MPCAVRRVRAPALTVAAVLLSAVLHGHAEWALAGPARQPVPATATPGVPAGPPVSLAGDWSVTRTYYRSCGACGSPVIRSDPWVITQVGGDVKIDRGLRGTVTGAGPAYLDLGGTETGGVEVLRLWYGTLHVNATGDRFEGTFNGSVSLENPCGSNPPAVTCFVSGGWIRGVLVQRAPGAAPTATETPAATATTAPTIPPPPTVGPPPPSPTPSPRPTVILSSASTRAVFPHVFVSRP